MRPGARRSPGVPPHDRHAVVDPHRAGPHYVAGYSHFAGASALPYITTAGGTHIPLPSFDPVPVIMTETGPQLRMPRAVGGDGVADVEQERAPTLR